MGASVGLVTSLGAVAYGTVASGADVGVSPSLESRTVSGVRVRGAGLPRNVHDGSGAKVTLTPLIFDDIGSFGESCLFLPFRLVRHKSGDQIIAMSLDCKKEFIICNLKLWRYHVCLQREYKDH